MQKVIQNITHGRPLAGLVSPAGTHDVPDAMLGLCWHCWPLLAQDQALYLLRKDMMPWRLPDMEQVSC